MIIISTTKKKLKRLNVIILFKNKNTLSKLPSKINEWKIILKNESHITEPRREREIEHDFEKVKQKNESARKPCGHPHNRDFAAGLAGHTDQVFFFLFTVVI